MSQYEVSRTDDNNPPIFVDTSTTKKQLGIVWTGQYYSRYGETLHENLLRVLENFASDLEPGHDDDIEATYNHAKGMLWYHTDDDDHFSNEILKIYNDNSDNNTNGWKRIEVIFSDTMPVNHTEGELWYDTSNKALNFSRGTNWEELTVYSALDSQLLNGLHSSQFLRSDIDDTAFGNLELQNIFPAANKSLDSGSSTRKWRTMYSELLDTEFSKSLIPDQDNTYDLGSSSLIWREINVDVVKGNRYRNLIPDNSSQTIGNTSNKWNRLHVVRISADSSDTLIPTNNTMDLGSNTNRWNNLFLNVLDTNTSKSLIPDTGNRTLGNSGSRWEEIHVDLIRDAMTHNLEPVVDSVYDLGSTNNHYRGLYLDNLMSDVFSEGDIEFKILSSGKSKGLHWDGLNDRHSIYSELHSGSNNTRLVVNISDNSNDYFSVQHNEDEKLAVKEDIIEAKAGVLKTKGIMRVESETSTNGCDIEFNTSTNSLDFRFY